MDIRDTHCASAISGSYGGMNLGDEAILEGILGQLRATLSADITVFSRNPVGYAGPAPGRARHRRSSLTRREMAPRTSSSSIS